MTAGSDEPRGEDALPNADARGLTRCREALEDMIDLAAGLNDDDCWYGKRRNAEERIAAARATLSGATPRGTDSSRKWVIRLGDAMRLNGQRYEVVSVVIADNGDRVPLLERLGPVDEQASSLGARQADAEIVARLFHETYERLAPSFGYATRTESAVPWDRVPAANRALMVAVAETVLAALSAGTEVVSTDAHEVIEIDEDGNVHGPRPIGPIRESGEGAHG